MTLKQKNHFTFYLIAIALSLLTISTFNIKASLVSFACSIIALAINIRKASSINLPAFFIPLIILNLYFYTNILFNDFYENNIIKFILYEIQFISAAFIIQANIIKQEQIIKIVKICLLIHVSLFYFQLINYYLTNNFIDINNLIREDNAVSWYESDALIQQKLLSIRATGAYSEPSFYAMVVATLISYLLFTQKKYSPLIWVSIISSYLSLSVAAIIINSLIITTTFLTLKNQTKTKLALLSIALISLGPIYSYYNLKINLASDYDAIQSRNYIVQEIKQNKIIENAFGLGIFWDDREPIGTYSLSGANIRDSSFYLYSIFTTGFIGLLIFILFLVLLTHKKIIPLIYVLILLLFKFHYLNGMFWLLLLLFHSATKKIE